MPRTLALDVGRRRIGIAITDELGFTAQPLLTLHRTTPRADLRSIARLIRRYDVTTLVIGLPLHASGDDSAQAEKTRTFAAELAAHLTQTSSPQPKSLTAPPRPTIVLLDERHTTAEAHALLDASQGRRHTAADRDTRSALIDQAAATLLLTAWLERTNGPTLLPPDTP
jgi:putative Holliday junction resolvase